MLYSQSAPKNFAKPTFTNQKQNIITGPNLKPWEKGLMYWTHTDVNSEPMDREEGPLPIQGNIGNLIKLEVNNYKGCSPNFEISGSNNCTTAFIPDLYTQEDTCGNECTLKEPESFGDKNFGFDTSNKYTNAHGLHAYKNVRAGAEGQSSQTGCYDFNPGISSVGSVCGSNPNPAYKTVPDWNKINKNLTASSTSWTSVFK